MQGRCIVRNSNESKLAQTIAVDYYCGYLVNEYGRQSLYDLPAYGGANSAVRASTLRAFGGWNEETVTEDTDLTLRLVLAGLRVRYDVTAIDTEESVSNFRRFWRQRYRWARGHQLAWREYRRWVWHAPGLSFGQRIETTMFLLVYHVPVACGFGAALHRGARSRHHHLGLEHRPHPDRDPPVPRSPARARRRADREPGAAEGRARDPAVRPRVRRVHDRVHQVVVRRPARAAVRVAQDAAHRPRPGAHDRRRRSGAGGGGVVSRQWAIVVLRLGLTFTTVWVGFLLLVNPWRRARSHAASPACCTRVGADRVRDGYGNQILVVPWTQRPFLATISPSCSAIAAVLAFGAIAAFLVKGAAHRRLLAFLGASVFIVACNVLRIAASILVGIETGSRGLVVFHDWVGTLLGLIALLGGFVIFVFIQLPSTRKLLEEAMRAA